jgi:hypothetical protein
MFDKSIAENFIKFIKIIINLDIFFDGLSKISLKFSDDLLFQSFQTIREFKEQLKS